jgi:hypothetical protein
LKPLSFVGNTYKWDRGFITFQDEFTLKTSWGIGTYKKYDDRVIEASCNGYPHIVVFNKTYTEYVSTRRGDLDYLKGSLLSN